MKTLTNDNWTSLFSEGDMSIKTLTVGYKTPYEDGSVTLHRDNGTYSTPVRDKLSTHGPRNKRSMPLTPNGDDNTHLGISRSDKLGQEGNLKSTQVKFLPLK